MAAGLVEKAARLSTEHWLGSAGIAKRAAVLRKVATLLIDADAVAYTDYIKALRRARGLHTAQREALISPARERIVEVPLSIVRAAAEAADLAAELAAHGNPNLRSDAYTALQLAAAAARSACVTLAQNVRSPRDPRLVDARRLVKTASERASRLRAPLPPGGRGRAPARSRGSGRR